MKAAKTDQSETEQASTPKMEGDFLEPLKRLTNKSSTKIPRLIPCFFHCKCVFSSSKISFNSFMCTSSSCLFKSGFDSSFTTFNSTAGYLFTWLEEVSFTQISLAFSNECTDKVPSSVVIQIIVTT